MSLQGFTNLNDSLTSTNVCENLVSFIGHGLLEKGNFENVVIPTTGVDGTLRHVLSYTDDPNYSAGRVWEGYRGDWVWESGVGALVSSNNSTPGVSGVYISNTFYPTSTTGTYAHYIDHVNGRVIFDSPIATGTSVQCEFSPRYVSVQRSDGLPWIKRITDGDYNLSTASVKPPVIGIEYVGRRFKPAGLGGRRYVYTDILIHCVANDSYTRDQLIDIVSLQNEKTFMMYDLNAIASANAFPLDYRGVPVSGALLYEELVTEYPDRSVYLFDMRLDSKYILGQFYIGSVKCTTEVIAGV